MSHRIALGLLGGAALASAVFLVLELAPFTGGVVAAAAAATARRASAAPPGAPEPGGDGAATASAAAADLGAGPPAGPVPPEEVRAAPPALVVGPRGELTEVPSGLAGRRATKRGTAAAVPWDRVAVVARVSELGRLSRPVARGLSQTRERLAPCYAEERRALAAGRAPPFDPADPPAGPAILILDLETRPGGVEVVSANVDSLGTSTAELAGCAVQALTGHVFDAPGAHPGRRFRLMHLLR